MIRGKRSIRPDWRKRNIMLIDITVVLFFVLAVWGMIIGYKQHNNSYKAEGGHASSTEALSRGTPSSSRIGGSGMSRFAPSAFHQSGGIENASTSQDETISPVTPPDNQIATSSRSTKDTPLVTVAQLERVRFKDVTSNSYKNMRLGFVMELPANWRQYYEHSDEVLFVSDVVTVGESIDDVRHTPNAMWISVGTTCQSADATSTSFAIFYASTTPTRERYVCIPPLKINMGLRADQANIFDRQAFLLDIARTIYPIVPL